MLASNWEIIRDELFQYEKEYGINGINTYNAPDLDTNRSWRNIYLDNFLWRKHGNWKYFLKTKQLIERVDGYTYAAFSILDSQGEIKEHYGDTNGIIRCHLGLSIPASYPDCGIRVGKSYSDWKEGEFTLFTEAHLHNTWNHTSESRYIFVVDIIHPNFRNKKWLICSSVLGAQTYNFFERRIGLLKLLPNFILKPIHWILTLIWMMYLPIQRFI